MTVASPAQTKARAPSRSTPHVEPTFVFGARVNGQSNEPSAATAIRYHGADPFAWHGPTGNAYALPCQGSDGAPLGPRALTNYLDEFFRFAQANPEQRFRVARLGCGDAAMRDADMAKLWRQAPKNCALPAVWQKELAHPELARILVFDPLVRLKSALWREILARFLSLNLPLWGVTRCEFVSSAGPRGSQCTADAAKELGYPHREIRADPGYYKEHADTASDFLAIWHATHLLSVTDPDQTSVPSHVRLVNYAMRDGLMVDDLHMDNEP
ncbi:MAG: hypothetical protein AB7O21_08355 [Gammaproteobacteria bacterium]